MAVGLRLNHAMTRSPNSSGWVAEASIWPVFGTSHSLVALGFNECSSRECHGGIVRCFLDAIGDQITTAHAVREAIPQQTASASMGRGATRSEESM